VAPGHRRCHGCDAGRFLADKIKPASVIMSDGLKSYPIAVGSDYVRTSPSISPARVCPPTCRCPACTASPPW